MKKNSESGQTLMEYIMLVVLIGIASIVAARSFGTEIKNQIKEAKERISSWKSGSD